MERQLLPDDHLTEAVHHLVEEAVLLAGGHAPDARHLLLAILKTHAPIVQQLLPKIDLDALTEAVQRELQNSNSSIAVPYESVIELAIRIAEREQRPQVDEMHLLKAIALLSGLIPRESVFPAPPALLQIGANLTEQARQGALPRVVGREAEIALLTETLCRPVNPYAVLVGLEGVGRRAVVQGVAEHIADDTAPEPLRKRPLIMLPQLFDNPELMGKLIEEATQLNAILYIEAFESFLSAPAPPIEMLRQEFLSALIARRVPIIGAVSSLEMFRRYVHRAPDLLKRFQPIEVRPMTREETLQVLVQLASLFEQQHGLAFPNETLQPDCAGRRRAYPAPPVPRQGDSADGSHRGQGAGAGHRVHRAAYGVGDRRRRHGAADWQGRGGDARIAARAGIVPQVARDGAGRRHRDAGARVQPQNPPLRPAS
jgi:ATP-dependent Clp protease ATP-binding subunit ClpA